MGGTWEFTTNEEFGVNNQELMAGWARERLIAIHRATPAPGGDVTALAYEVARSYGELATFLPGVQPPPGDPGQWAPGAVVKAGAAVIGVLDELRTPGDRGRATTCRSCSSPPPSNEP